MSSSMIEDNGNAGRCHLMRRRLPLAFGMSRRLANAQIAVCVITALIVVQARAADSFSHIQTAQNVDHEKFEKKLEDVRDNIDKNPRTAPSMPNRKTPAAQPIDVCKVNPRLPQCQK